MLSGSFGTGRLVLMILIACCGMMPFVAPAAEQNVDIKVQGSDTQGDSLDSITQQFRSGEDRFARRIALSAGANRYEKEAIPLLTEALQDADDMVKAYAALLMSNLGDFSFVTVGRQVFERTARLLWGATDLSDTFDLSAAERQTFRCVYELSNALSRAGESLVYEMAVAIVLDKDRGPETAKIGYNILYSLARSDKSRLESAKVDPLSVLCSTVRIERDVRFFRATAGLALVLEDKASRLRLTDAVISAEDPPDLEAALHLSKAIRHEETAATPEPRQHLLKLPSKCISFGVLRKGISVTETMRIPVEPEMQVEAALPDDRKGMSVVLSRVKGKSGEIVEVAVTWTTPQEPGFVSVPLTIRTKKAETVDDQEILCMGLVARDEIPDYAFRRFIR